MGTLRTLLAISVVLAHSIGYLTLGERDDVLLFIGGENAVQCFYMISGFLISYILVEKKAYSTITDFYINRYLRLYPTYLVVALLTLIALPLASSFGKGVNLFKVYETAPILANVILIFSNAALFLQDWVMFLGVKNNELIFITDFSKSDIILSKGLLLPQAWTLGLELTFYLIAPFVLLRINLLLLLLTLSIALRVYLIQIGVGRADPWTYRFFPTELALFLIGALSHQFVLTYYRKVFLASQLHYLAVIATYVLILVTLTYWLLPSNEFLNKIVLFSLFFLLLPLSFLYQSTRGWDKWIGDLSYPIYIGHILVIGCISVVLNKFDISEKIVTAILSVVLSIAFSIALNLIVGSPIEKIRNRFRTAHNISRVELK